MLLASFNTEKLSKMKNFIILSTALIAFQTYAQNVHELEAIDVVELRGSKNEKSYLESNESISILKEKNLNRGDITNSVQMLNGLANIKTQSDKNGDTFSIRGISDMGVTGYQKDNLATIMVDEIFQTSLALRAGSFENWNLERIEVHRGAQSTDQGVNSLAGNILLYHGRASQTKEGEAKLAFGNFGRREGALVVNEALSEKISTRLSYNYEATDGYIKNIATGNEKWNERKRHHLSTDFLYQLNSTDELRFNVKILRIHRGGSYVQDNFRDYRVSEDQDYKEITNNQQASLTYLKKLSANASNKLILGASQADSTVKSDEDGTALNTAGTRQGNDKDEFISLENQLKYKSDKIKNVLGIHLHHYYLNNHYQMNLMFTPSLIYPVEQENTKYRTTYALFDSLTYFLTPEHSLHLGGRFEVVKNKFGADITIPSTSPYASLSGNHEDTSTNTVFLPKLGYNYQYGKYSLGATYTQGYRTGGISVNRWRATTNSYDPEKTHNYEISYKYLQSRFHFAANAFYTKWNDQQVDVIYTNSFDTQVRNASSSELYGAEIESSYEFKNDDSMRFNLGYVHTQFLNFKNQDRNFGGNYFPDSAPVTGQISYWKALNEAWRFILVSHYISESYTDPDNLRWSPEQFYTHMNLQYNFEQYLLEFYVRNVFNQKYRLYNGAPRSTTTPYQASYHRMSPPREFGLRLNYYW
jgi:iron complex outermembrane receptor protein